MTGLLVEPRILPEHTEDKETDSGGVMKYDWGASFFFSLFLINYLGTWMDRPEPEMAPEPVPFEMSETSEHTDPFAVFLSNLDNRD